MKKTPLAVQIPASPREKVRFDENWKFALGHVADPEKDFYYRQGMPLAKIGDAVECAYGAVTANFDDSGWRVLDLPHDWANELPFTSDSKFHSATPWRVADHGFKPVGPYFPETSIGWYRKTFTIPANDEGRRVNLVLDGAFRDTELWLNTHRIGRHEGGYTGFRFDLTDYLNYGGNNVLVLRVDATKFEGWYYEGAGIYRHVWLEKTYPVHVAPYGLQVVVDREGKVLASVSVLSEGSAYSTPVEAQICILDAQGRTVASTTTRLPVAAQTSLPELIIAEPRLWSLEDPYLYRYQLTLSQNGVLLDLMDTCFGVRTASFDPDRGFFLNGEHVLIKGACMHQDAAGVGIAVPDAMLEWRLKELKKWGFNAYRTAHHAPAPELLDFCDQLGLLVVDETRLVGSSPDALSDLRYLVERDRNHPCVILWSLGNEETGIQETESGRRIAATMKRLIRSLDDTRPVTYASNAGENDQGIMSQLDVFGINYTRLGDNFDNIHQKYSLLPMVGTEEASTLCTRGIYMPDTQRGYLSAYDTTVPLWGKTAEGWVRDYSDRVWLAGAFIWAGFDYRGEPNPYSWPCISSHFGVLDTCGFPKDNAWYYKAWWTYEPVLHIFPHWNWLGCEGQEIDVRCFSNHDEVELFLNGESLGRQPIPERSHVAWKVKFAPGQLTAKGYRQGKLVAVNEVATTDEPVQVKAETDRYIYKADGRDCAVINVAVCDAEGRCVPTAQLMLNFKISPNARILGVGNGDPSCHESDICSTNKWSRSTFNGLCQIIIAAPKTPGDFRLEIFADMVSGCSIEMKAE